MIMMIDCWHTVQEACPSILEEEALSVDPDLETHSETAEISIARKRKRGNTKYNHQQDMLNLESEKIKWMRQQEDRQDDDDYLFVLKSLLPCIKRMSFSTKLIFRSQIQNLLASEMSALDRRNLRQRDHRPFSMKILYNT